MSAQNGSAPSICSRRGADRTKLCSLRSDGTTSRLLVRVTACEATAPRRPIGQAVVLASRIGGDIHIPSFPLPEFPE